MKKFTHFLAMAAMLALPFATTSCDDPWEGPRNWHEGGYPDNGNNGGNTLYDMANVLCGEWYGPVNLYEEQTDGTFLRYNFDADMVFYTNNTGNSLSGSGLETDYAQDEDGTTHQQQLRFTWRIDESTGDIYITYTESKTSFVLDYSATQRGFSLSDNEFYGYMLGYNNNDYMVFDFSRASSRAKASGIASTTTANAVFGSGATPSELVTDVPQKLPQR